MALSFSTLFILSRANVVFTDNEVSDEKWLANLVAALKDQKNDEITSALDGDSKLREPCFVIIGK